MFRQVPFRRIPAALICVALLDISKAAPQWYSKDSTPPILPAPVSFNQEAGQGDSLFITLRSESGEDWVFGVDTGSPVTMLDKSLEEKLGKRISEKQAPTGWLVLIPAGIFRSPKLFIGETPLVFGERVWTTDLSRMSSTHRMMGILGMDCLHHYCLQLDFAAHKISFLNPDSVAANQGNAFPLRVTQAGVAVKTSFGSTNEVECGIDSAEYLDGSLKPDLFQAALRNDPQAVVKQWKDSAGNVFREAHFKMGQFNGETCTNLIVREHSNGENTVGLHLLARHLVIFNFPKQMMYLQRRP